ncbi:hypothetical protein LJC31_00290 [Synergistaceae bacterium OttesenSCG-928-I11]|nr:hypothetical protein [Synergistaceae bacterium OttesenSCG-928-I11]
MRKKTALIVCLVTLFCFMTGAIMASAHGGSHHPEPGHSGGSNHNLDGNFHHYDHQNNYGQNHNVWCNGTNQQLSQHHSGNAVSADLSSGSSFVGGFCMKSTVQSGEVLEIQYQNLVDHDKVWLKSGDQSYYPIDKASNENFILVEDNSWSDRNPTVGEVEADVLLSTRGGNNSSDNSGGGGGCNALGIGGLLLVGLIPAVLCLAGKNKKNK